MSDLCRGLRSKALNEAVRWQESKSKWCGLCQGQGVIGWIVVHSTPSVVRYAVCPRCGGAKELTDIPFV